MFFGKEVTPMCKRSIQLIRTHLSSSQGFTFIDSLLGIICIAIALTALLITYTSSTKATIAATNRTQAIYLAQQVIEEKMKPQDGSSSISLPVFPQPIVINNISYTVTANYSDVSSIAAANGLNQYIKPYTITVSWSDATSPNTAQNLAVNGYAYATP